MRSNSLIFRTYLVFFVVLVLMCSCDSFRIRVKPKVKRKVESVNYVKGNRIIEVGEGKNNNVTDKANGRGFLHPGSLFSLGKVLNFFPVGGERECQASKGNTIARSGICLNPYDCRQRDGKAGGDCAHGLGVCCVFEVTCGGEVRNNLTYFMSPRFPELWGGQTECNITIDKTHAGIMQLRIDFVHFSIGQPNRQTGDCDQDVMTIGDGGNLFRMCGQNHGQHIYYTLSTASESRADDELPGSKQTRLSIRSRGGLEPRLWLMRLAQMPLAYSAPHDCLQYFTASEGIISTFNYASNGRYLANQNYRACIRKNTGMCAVKYTPCDDRSFRIGPTRELQNYAADPVQEDGMLPVNDQVANDPVNDDVAEDMVEGSGADPGIEPAVAPVAAPSMGSRIWSFMFPSWLWGQSSRQARVWGFWSPYAQHYSSKQDPVLYEGYGNFGVDLKGFGRQRCQDRITIPCDNEYFISNTSYVSGVCDPHHCGSSLCPADPAAPVAPCAVLSSVSPFAVSVRFGAPERADAKSRAEDNTGACLAYTQVKCDE